MSLNRSGARVRAVTCCFLISTSLHAEVTLDGSVGGAAPGQPVAPGNGFTYDITENLGTTQGVNLFHSFERFNVNVGESANFSGNAAIGRIIARITGGTLTDIDGTLTSSIAGADLWLINPAGVMIGPNAVIDLSGSLNLGTADFLQFSDGVEFSASLNTPTTLTTADPRAFGFVTSASAGLGVSGSTLRTPVGERVALVGGDISVDGADLEGGGITIGAGPFDGGLYDPALPGVVANGELTVVDTRVATLGGLDVVIEGGLITISGSTLVDESFGGSSSDVAILGDSVVIENASTLRRLSTGTGSTGSMTLGGGSLVRVDGSVLRSDTSTAAATGEIRLEAAAVELSESLINVDSFDGDTGSVVLLGSDVTLSSSRVASTSGGTGAPILIAGGALRLLDSSSLESTSFSAISAPIFINGDSVLLDGSGNFVGTTSSGFFARGGDILVNGGTVTIGADNLSTTTDFGLAGNLFLSGGSLVLTDTVGTTGSFLFGTGGGVFIQADELDLVRTGLLATSLFGTSGDVVLNAQRATLTGSALASESSGSGISGSVLVDVGVLELFDFSTLSARTAGNMDAGVVDVAAGQLRIAGGSTIGTEQVSQFGAGASGDVFISAGLVEISNGGFVQSTTVGPGDAGNIFIGTNRLLLTGNAAINAATLGSGAGGTIFIDAGEVLVDQSGIGADTLGGGAGGRIEILTDQLSLTRGGNVTAVTRGPSPGGAVSINAAALFMDQGEITTRTLHLGDAGDVALTFDALTMADDSRIAADTLGGGDGGSVTLQGGTVEMSGRSFISTLSAVLPDCGICQGADGQAGDISIDFSDLTLADRSVVVSETETAGSAGAIRLTGENFLLDGGEMSARTLASGEAGDTIITLSGNFIARDGFITSASTTDSIDAGSAGSIQITADAVDILGTSISAATASNNPANDVATIDILSGGQFTLDSGTIEATTSGAVAGGDVSLQAVDLQLLNSGSVTTDATGSGDSGRIRIDTGQTLVVVGSSIRTNAQRSEGGDILINAASGSTVGLSEATIEASAGANGSGGDIDITAGQILIRRSGILAEADAGNGGQIDLNAMIVLEDVESLVSADSNSGNAGTINVSAPDDDISAAVTPQNENVIPPQRVAQSRCSPETRRTASSLVLADRGGVIRAHDDYALSSYRLPAPGEDSVAESSEAGLALIAIACVEREEGP